jgi:general secretion pathway protein G
MKRRVIWSVGAAVAFALIIVLLGFKLFGGRSYPRDAVCEGDLIALATQIELFKQEQGRYPTSDEGLEILAHQPGESANLPRWRKYISSVPLDPWQRPYRYICPGRRNPQTFDLFSLGPDGVESSDDIYAPSGQGKTSKKGEKGAFGRKKGSDWACLDFSDSVLG